MLRRFFISELLLCCACAVCAARDFEPPQGTLLLHGSGELSGSDAAAFAKLAGGEKAKLVILSTKADAAEHFKKCGVASLKCLDCSSAAEALREATGAWLDESDIGKITKGNVRSEIEKELRALLGRGGVVGGSGAGAGMLAEDSISNLQYWTPPKDPPRGLSLLRDVAVKLTGEHQDPKLETPSTKVVFELQPASTLLIQGRKMAAFEAPVTIRIARNKTREEFKQTLRPGQPADLTTLRRALYERTQPQFPPEKMDPPELKAGTLVIDGGGIPKVAMTRFIEAAGGPDALILVCPSAQGDGPPPADPGEGKLLKRAGAKNVKVFHLSHAEASDEEKIRILREAKGLWFCGGRQWRYVDAYLDTPAEKLMHEILARGGAIGGSSAGATIQGDYLVRGNPLGNIEMMVEGYERGLGFLKGVAVDQHFFKRNRFKDMSALKKAFPQILGLGLDEGAAIVVTGHTLEVVGIAPIATSARHRKRMKRITSS